MEKSAPHAPLSLLQRVRPNFSAHNRFARHMLATAQPTPANRKALDGWSRTGYDCIRKGYRRARPLAWEAPETRADTAARMDGGGAQGERQCGHCGRDGDSGARRHGQTARDGERPSASRKALDGWGRTGCDCIRKGYRRAWPLAREARGARWNAGRAVERGECRGGADPALADEIAPPLLERWRIVDGLSGCGSDGVKARIGRRQGAGWA